MFQEEKGCGGFVLLCFVSEQLSLCWTTPCPRKPMFYFLEKYLGSEPSPQAFLDTQNGQRILSEKNIFNSSLEKSRVVGSKRKGRGCEQENMSADVANKGQMPHEDEFWFPKYGMPCVVWERHTLCEPKQHFESLSIFLKWYFKQLPNFWIPVFIPMAFLKDLFWYLLGISK